MIPIIDVKLPKLFTEKYSNNYKEKHRIYSRNYYYEKEMIDSQKKQKKLERKKRYMEKLKTDPQRYNSYLSKVREKNKINYQRKRIERNIIKKISGDGKAMAYFIMRKLFNKVKKNELNLDQAKKYFEIWEWLLTIEKNKVKNQKLLINLLEQI